MIEPDKTPFYDLWHSARSYPTVREGQKAVDIQFRGVLIANGMWYADEGRSMPDKDLFLIVGLYNRYCMRLLDVLAALAPDALGGGVVHVASDHDGNWYRVLERVRAHSPPVVLRSRFFSDWVKAADVYQYIAEKLGVDREELRKYVDRDPRWRDGGGLRDTRENWW